MSGFPAPAGIGNRKCSGAFVRPSCSLHNCEKKTIATSVPRTAQSTCLQRRHSSAHIPWGASFSCTFFVVADLAMNESGGGDADEALVKQLVDMGFDRPRAATALAIHANNFA